MTNSNSAQSMDSFLASHPVVLQILKFGAIGILNTTLDFIILNFVSKFLGITIGSGLGLINIIGFSAAVVQSYYWNRAWTFAGAIANIGYAKQAGRLILVGGLGAIALAGVFLGARVTAGPVWYLILLAVFIAGELLLWRWFSLSSEESGNTSFQLVSFFIVSIIGLVINSILLVALSRYLQGSLDVSPDLIKNLAKIFATGASLVWNFIGYKVIVFRR